MKVWGQINLITRTDVAIEATRVKTSLIQWKSKRRALQDEELRDQISDHLRLKDTAKRVEIEVRWRFQMLDAIWIEYLNKSGGLEIEDLQPLVN